MFKLGKKKATPTITPEASPLPLEATPDHIRLVANQIRNTAQAQQAEDEANKTYDQLRRQEQWQNTLTALETMYGIPSNWVENANPEADWTLSGYYRGPIRILGKPLRIETELLNTSLNGNAEYRIRFVDPKNRDRHLPASELAEMLERLAETIA